jgi:integrase
VKALLLEKLSGGLKTNSVINMKNLISGIYNLAIEEEVVQANPATRVCKYIRLPERKKCIAVLSKEEVSTLLGLVLQKYPQHYPVLLAAFRTGLRMGELAGLAWEDINFDANMIQVRRSYSHGLFSTPKNRKHRYVDMSGQLKQSLLGYQSARLREQGGKLPITKLPSQFASDDNVRLVFAEPDGSPADLDNFRRSKFYKYLKEANVPHIRFHDIRHTFASLLLQQGESLHYVKEQMGHASIQTTVDVYGHIVPWSNRNAVNKLDDNNTPVLKLVSSAG